MKKVKRNILKKKPRIYYDKEADVLWFNIKSGPEEEYREIAPGVGLELGDNGELLGIEILDASKVLFPKLGIKEKDLNKQASIPHKIR